jgi:hypothetical protein
MRYRLQEDGDDVGRNERRLSDGRSLSTGFVRPREKAASLLGMEQHGATQREIVFGVPF